MAEAGSIPAVLAIPALGTWSTAEHREPDEWRHSRPVLGGGGGATPLLYSTHTSAGLVVTRDASILTGGGTNYLGTVANIPVFGAAALTNQAIVCSRVLLRAVSYAVVHGLDDIADFDFVEGVEPEKSRVVVKVAQRIEWGEDVFVEFDLRGAAGQD